MNWKTFAQFVSAAAGIALTSWLAFSWALSPLHARLDRIDSELSSIHRDVGELQASLRIVLQALRMRGGVPSQASQSGSAKQPRAEAARHENRATASPRLSFAGRDGGNSAADGRPAGTVVLTSPSPPAGRPGCRDVFEGLEWWIR